MSVDIERLRALAGQLEAFTVSSAGYGLAHPAITLEAADAILDLLDERDALVRDVERHIAIAAEHLGDAEALRVERDEAIRERDALVEAWGTWQEDARRYCLNADHWRAERDALAALLQRARTALADMDRACDRDLIDAIDALDGAKGTT